MELVALPEGADLDALSSAYAALKLYPEAKLLKPSQFSKSASRAFKRFKHLFRLTEEIPKEVERLILVDTCSLERFKQLPRYRELVVYDHHEGCKLPDAILKVEKVGACTTILVGELEKKGLPLSGEEATLLLLGIYEDTGKFLHLGTTPRDLRAAAFLLEKGADLSEVERILEERLSKKDLEVLTDLLEGIEYLKTPEGFRVAVATFRGEDYRPDFQELIYRIREFTENVDGFFIIYEAGGKTYVFGRSNNAGFDSSAVLRKLGGGGHAEASSLKLEGISAERVKRRLKEVLTGRLENLYLENFVSRPPLVVKKEEGIEEALKKLVDFGFAGAPVVDDRMKPVGVVFKKDLLRALKHLKEKPLKVSDVMDTDIKVLSLRDTLWEAEEVLAKYGKKLLPVVDEEGKVVGVITRLDLFRNIISETPVGRGRKVELPSNIRDFAAEVGRIAEEMGLKAYIVGGVVRDIILQRPVWDLDVVVEGGNAVELAKRVAERFGVKVHPFEEFGTAHLKFGKLKVEFATARRERYEEVGAYPQVETASLKEDLFRRDFTINTMALALNPDRFGELIDLLGGLEDLKKGVIRVLHSLSFVEDPIRILRALRFAGRFGFELSKATRMLLRRAVELGVLKKAPKGRIANELRLALREDRFIEILKLYKKYGVLEQIFPEGFTWSKVDWSKLEKLKQLLDEFREFTDIPGWVMLVFLLLQYPEEKALRFLGELSAPSKVREIYLTAKRELGRISKLVREVRYPSELRRNLKRYPDEVIILAAAAGGEKVEKLVRFYLREVKPLKVKVDVEPLKRKGLKGKDLGKEIERLKDQKLDEILREKWKSIAEGIKS